MAVEKKIEGDAEVSLEQRFGKIEEIINQMESGDLPIDTAFQLYKNGLEQVRAANAMLDEIEKAMLVLNTEGDLEEFEA